MKNEFDVLQRIYFFIVGAFLAIGIFSLAFWSVVAI